MVSSSSSLPRFSTSNPRTVFIALLLSVAFSFGHASGTKRIRGLQIPRQAAGTGNLTPKATYVKPIIDAVSDQDTAFYEFAINGLLPSQVPSDAPSLSPSRSPIISPSESPTKLPFNAPRESSSPSPNIEPTEPLTPPPSSETPTTTKPSESPTGTPTTTAPSDSPSETRVEEVVEAQERDPLEGDDLDPTDADQFLPVLDPTYYYVELRPFSVFVNADQDLSSDLGIPLYLLLEMGETLTSLVDIKITNLTIHMGVVMTPNNNVRHRDLSENHYHTNQLFFQGFAQLDDSTIYPPETVENVQSLVLSNPTGLQNFWNDEGYGQTYSNLEVMNITLLPWPVVPVTEPPTETQPPPTQETAPVVIPEASSKRESNIWIMVPIVLVFLLICFCIICLAGRLQYLASRAQDKYNEKYGLDYNIYGKDISKDIFKEEYLNSENHDADFGHSDHVRSIDFIKPSRSSLRKSKRGSKKEKRVRLPMEDHSTTEEEEEIHEQRKVLPAEQVAGGFPSFAPRSIMERNVVVDHGIVLPQLGNTDGDDSDSDTASEISGPQETVPPDEDEMVVSSSNVAKDGGDYMPTIIKVGGPSLLDSSENDESARSRDDRSRDDATFASRETKAMGNLSGRDRSGRDRSGRYQNRTSSFNSTGSLGNSSRGSRGDRSSRFSQNRGSFNAGDDSNAMGSSVRSTRSNRSVRSATSDSSMGSFYSAQGDLV